MCGACGAGEAEEPAWAEGARTRDMTRPIEAREMPSWNLQAWAAWLWM